MTDTPQLRMLADRMVSWQTSYGAPDPQTCPWVTPGLPGGSPHFHSPSFMAIGLYSAYEATGEPAYKAAADRYAIYYLACLRNPPDAADAYAQAWIEHMNATYGPSPQRDIWAIHILTWPFMYGMALAAFREFRRHNAGEVALDSKAAALIDWMLYWRWDEGSYFRNGYGVPDKGIVDCANSDDNCHIGRGLMGYHELTGRADALGHAERLAEYYLTELEPGTYKGCWSSTLGSWAAAPTTAEGFEHFTGIKACEIAHGWTSVGGIDYLTRLAAVTTDTGLRERIAEKCVASMRWHYDACQFPDGAVGMSGRDDKWLGQTAGAILSFLRVRDAGFLSDAEAVAYRAKALLARDWLLEHLTPAGLDAGGYSQVTGQSEPRPPENTAWMFGWVLEALPRLDTV